MLTMWGINSNAEVYVPGAIRARRQVEKVSPTPPPSSPKGTQYDGTPGRRSELIREKVQEIYGDFEGEARKRGPAILAQQIMTSPVVSIDVKASMAEAWELFHQRRFRHVPILSNHERLVGILSDRDLLREAAGFHKKPRAKSIEPSQRLVQDRAGIGGIQRETVERGRGSLDR